MILERNINEMVIRIPNDVKFEFLQDLLDYLSVKINLSKSEATEDDIEKLSEELKENWVERKQTQIY